MAANILWADLDNVLKLEYMIRGCERAFGEIRGEEPGGPTVDSYGQRV